MIDLGFISFATPWALAAAIALPAIWLLLRMTPPAITRVVFPAVFLMFGLKPTERTPARTPWWLVAFRILIAALVIAGLAEPVLNAQRLSDNGPVIVVVDDTWAASQQWPARMAAARDIVEGADLRRRPVMLITTAARPASEGIANFALSDARETLGRISQLEPKPWGPDLASILSGLDKAVLERGDVFWLSDGVDDANRQALATALQRFGPVAVITAARSDQTFILSQPLRSASDGGTSKVEIEARRVVSPSARAAHAISIQAFDMSGAIVAEGKASFADGAVVAKTTLALPNELANRIARFDVGVSASAASTALADDRWQQRPVGLFSAAAEGTTAPLLEDGFYLTQALEQTAEVRVGNVRDLLTRPLSMLVVSGGQRLTEDEVKTVSTWVDNGGLLVRFAGPRLDPAGDKLLPVKLRIAGRNLGGALSWGEPAGLGAFPDKSPFTNLAIPGDVKINTQILAEPSPDLPDKTWARLNDGTPLITAERRGAGWIVLFHVTATPEWSNLPLSGLFVSMLQTLLNLSQGVTTDDLETPPTLPPVILLDGFGRAVPPGPASTAIASDQLTKIAAGVGAPPGLYGTARGKFALNLGPSVWQAAAIESWPPGITTASLDTLKGERDLKPWILFAALMLLLADFVLSFVLRGLLPARSLFTSSAAKTAAVVFVCMLAVSTPVIAAETKKSDTTLDSASVESILQTRLAYVMTGSSELDRVSESGLAALTRALAARTSAEMGKPSGLDLSGNAMTAAKLMPYPIVYWRVSPEQSVPSSAAISAVNEYFRHGGMILFDAPDNVGAVGSRDGTGAGGKLREILSRIDIPPLMPLTDQHVLTRSFYLLPGLPGRYANGTVYVERGSSSNDGVSSVIIGGHDWAAAWARDEAGIPLYPVVPGGEQQREAAIRAGINMVMYALTGNYKSDQVHLPSIMQRLTQ